MTDPIPVLDLQRRAARFRPELYAAITRVLDRGVYLLGPEVAAFEEEFADYTGYRHAVGVASGTEALRLAMTAGGLEYGDEVVVPAFTAVPTAAAVCAAGGVPVFADVERRTATMDPQSATAAVTDRTRFVVPVHLYGRAATIPQIDGVGVIEDCAQSHGAVERREGTLAAAYSFYPTKNLGGVGDGGAVVTDDDALAAEIRFRRVHGMRDGYVHEEISTNSRMSELEAAAMRVFLQHLSGDNARRREIAMRYREAAPGLDWPEDYPMHVYHLCVVRVSDRDAFRASMPFDTAIHYQRALTEQPAYARYVRNACPEAEAWAAECVSLPCFPEMTDEEVETVSEALAEAESKWSR
ncbi:MAG: DegT/DnrJ/EryC1/StrS family aminotransferase [Acidimicrobiia bacterium]